MPDGITVADCSDDAVGEGNGAGGDSDTGGTAVVGGDDDSGVGARERAKVCGVASRSIGRAPAASSSSTSRSSMDGKVVGGTWPPDAAPPVRKNPLPVPSSPLSARLEPRSAAAGSRDDTPVPRGAVTARVPLLPPLKLATAAAATNERRRSTRSPAC